MYYVRILQEKTFSSSGHCRHRNQVHISGNVQENIPKWDELAVVDAVPQACKRDTHDFLRSDMYLAGVQMHCLAHIT